MKDCQFMTAVEKTKVLRQWELFLKNNLAREKFTQLLYHHLIQHCSFIAHYNLDGFYSEYFRRGKDRALFPSQFDNRKGIPQSVEYGATYWYTSPDYNDINSAKYIPGLTANAAEAQKLSDIAEAEKLLHKYGMKVVSKGGIRG